VRIRGALVLPGWGTGPELLAPLVPPGAPVAPADWGAARGADDLVPLALAAAARLEGPLAVVAWSLGAMVALETLPALAGRVARLHLVAPCLCFTEAWPERVLGRMRRRCAEDPAGVREAFARSMAAPGEAVPALAGEAPAAALVAGLDFLAGRALGAPARVPGCEVRIVHGEADAVVPARLSLPIAGALGAERLVLPGAGHAPHLTRAAECAAFLGIGEAHAPR
jgi:pimeloyl-[acyl-carrier protein] methyl ester esterase